MGGGVSLPQATLNLWGEGSVRLLSTPGLRRPGVGEQGSYHPEACTLGQKKEAMGGHWRESKETHMALQEAVNATPLGGPLTRATWAAVGHRCSPHMPDLLGS